MGDHRVTEKGTLLAAGGTLAEPGWATSPVWDYNRTDIAASKWRIKEWDYYLINDDEYAVALTVGDLGYMGLISASVVDFAAGGYKTTSIIPVLPLGRLNLPASSGAGVTQFANRRAKISFEVAEGRRTIRASFARFDGNDTLTVDAVLDQEPQDSLVIATPWKEDAHAFYYNQKTVGMRVRGSFKKGLLVHGFCPENSFGLLDWGRGVWTRDNTWFWAVAQGWQDGEGGAAEGSQRCAFNLGYGFGDTAAASENVFFLDGVAHKLGRVDFGIPEKAGAAEKRVDRRFDLMAPWHVKDDAGRLDLVFTPEIDRKDYISVGLVTTDQHQVFGRFEGTVVTDEGALFTLAGLRGSAEVVRNKY